MAETPETTDGQLRTVCAWCGFVLLDIPLGPGEHLSHGICLTCRTEWEARHPTGGASGTRK